MVKLMILIIESKGLCHDRSLGGVANGRQSVD